MITRTFPGAPGNANAACEPVDRLLRKLNAAGYGCALFRAIPRPGEFVMSGDADSGFAVTWEPVAGRAEVSA